VPNHEYDEDFCYETKSGRGEDPEVEEEDGEFGGTLNYHVEEFADVECLGFEVSEVNLVNRKG